MGNESNRELDLFSRVLELPPEERGAFLDEECSGDGELRRKLEKLLRVYERVGDFLEVSQADVPARAARTTRIGEKPGDKVGRYTLLQQIGEGGCGVVFSAEQWEPVRRRVALKILKPGMDTENVVARFEAERQTLALMDHPNIAKVFDAGATDSGRPYFVMELIQGVKITEYCDRNALGTEDRLKLFIEVCQAIQHAHQKGVIHRDIKPSNILVTTAQQGGTPMPVVIDFGIAKATTNQPLTDKALFTAVDMLVGTPAYMSPEQASFTHMDVDTRTDIYSLGVLLYEMLAGSTPFDTALLSKSSFDEIRQVIREQEPVCPSTRLKKITEADLTLIAQKRKSEPMRLIRTITGDLDWIVMKALEKDPCRRYETAFGLAQDVRRYLADEAIMARPPSSWYKLRKTILRNKLFFGGFALVGLLLMVGLVMVFIILARERQARQRAEIAAAKSDEVTKFLEDMLKGVGPSVALGRDTTILSEMLDQTAQRVGTDLTNQPAVEAELRGFIGQLYLQIGKYEKAQEMAQAALQIDRKLYGSQSREVAAALTDLGLAYERNVNLEDAVTADLEALNIREELGDVNGPDFADLLSNLAEVYTQQGRYGDAEKLVRRALALRQKLYSPDSLEVAQSLRDLAILLGDQGRWQDSEAMARQVLAIRQKHLKPEDPLIATTLTDIAWAAGAQGKLDEAESLERQALAIRRKVLPDNHPDVAQSLYLVGDRMRQRGEINESFTVLNEALGLETNLLGENNPVSLDTMHSLALVLEAQGKYTEAENMHAKTLAIWNKLGENDIPQATYEVQSYYHLLMTEKKYDQAEQLLDSFLTPDFAKKPYSTDLLISRSTYEAKHGFWQPAAADAFLVFQHQPYVSGRYSRIGALLVKANDLKRYDAFCRQLIPMFADSTNYMVEDDVAKACLFAPDPNLDLHAISHLADLEVILGANDQGAMPFLQICKALSEYRQGHYAEAAEWAQKTVIRQRTDAFAHAYGVLAMADWQLGKKDAARFALAKAETLAPAAMPQEEIDNPNDDWLAWLFARIQIAEADHLIENATNSAPFISGH